MKGKSHCTANTGIFPGRGATTTVCPMAVRKSGLVHQEFTLVDRESPAEGRGGNG